MTSTTSVVRHHGHFINGAEIAPASGRSPRHRPADGRLVAVALTGYAGTSGDAPRPVSIR